MGAGLKELRLAGIGGGGGAKGSSPTGRGGISMTGRLVLEGVAVVDRLGCG